MLALLVVSLAAAAPPELCNLPRTPEELDISLDNVEAAWGVDEAAFVAGMSNARDVLACLAAPVAPKLAARYHRVEGLAAYLERDTEASARAFAAARALDPAYTFPAAMVPADNPLQTTYTMLPPGGDAVRVPRAAKGASTWFDGTEGHDRPSDRPTVFQLEDGDGVVRTSAWVLPDQPLPYRARGEGLRAPLLIGAGVAAIGSGAMWVAAWQTHERLGQGDDPEDLYPDFESVEDAEAALVRMNALQVGAGATAALAVGFGTGAFVFGRW